MKIHYSHEVDALYIRFNQDVITDTDEISPEIIMDYNENGDIVGIEILSASSKADIKELIIKNFERVRVENTKTEAA